MYYYLIGCINYNLMSWQKGFIRWHCFATIFSLAFLKLGNVEISCFFISDFFQVITYAGPVANKNLLISTDLE